MPCSYGRATRFRRTALIAALSLAGVVGAARSGRASGYSLRILGTFRNDFVGMSTAEAINDSGLVAGSATDTGNQNVLFRWTAATGMTNQGILVAPYPTYALGINSSGTVSGFGLAQSNGFATPYRQFSGGSIEMLPKFGGDAYAFGVSEANLCAGWSNITNGCGGPACAGNPGRAITWDAGSPSITVLPNLGGYFSAAYDISPDGTKICGYGAIPSSQIRAFRLQGGVATPLPPLPGYDEAVGYGTNNVGQVVGYSALGSSERATLWNSTTPIDLGVPPGAIGSLAWRISESGEIVGYAIYAGNPVTYRAMTFEAGHPPTDLNGELASPSPWTLVFCNDVNASGVIVGQADSAGVQRGFILTPPAQASVPDGGRTARLTLAEPSPNPTRGGTDIRFSLAAPGRVRIVVLDVTGRVVTRLRDESMPAGDHLVRWEGRDDRGSRLRAGGYFIRLTAGGESAVTKAVIGG